MGATVDNGGPGQSMGGQLPTREVRRRAAAVIAAVALLTLIGGAPAAAATARPSKPAITSLTPSAGPLRGGQFVTIKGTAFRGATAVTFGGSPVPFLVKSRRTIVAAVPASAEPGAVQVRVVTPAGRSAWVAQGQYRYVPRPAPATVTPSSGDAAGGTEVVIRGTGLRRTTSVMFGDVPAQFTVDSHRRVTAIAPPGVGSVRILVHSPGGRSLWVESPRYRYLTEPVPLPVPVVTAVSPVSGPTAGGTEVTITGTDLDGATQVTFGDTPAAAFASLSSTTITAITPPGDGTVPVRVTTPAGTSAATPSGEFTYVDVPPPPAITAVSPNSGPSGGGTEVTITGTDLDGATQVTFGDTPATGFESLSSTTLTAVTPPGDPGTVPVRVTTPAGTSELTSAGEFTYVDVPPPPVITSLSPDSGAPSGGTQVTITGEHFDDVIDVRFGLTPAYVFMSASDQLRVFAPAGTVGPVDVVVTTAAGTSDPAVFTYVAPPALPVVESVSPGEGPIEGGTEVTITGSNFTGITAVTFGGIQSNDWEVLSSTMIRAVSPPGEEDNVLLHVVVHSTSGSSAMHMDSEWVYRR